MSLDKNKSAPGINKIKRHSALGKGYEALLGLGSIESETNPSSNEKSANKNIVEEFSKSAPVPTVSVESAANGLVYLNIGDIEPNPKQPRKLFDKDALNTLSASIANDGVIQPIIVTAHKGKPGKYIIVAGERRWRASQLAGLLKIPVIIKEFNDHTMLRVALIENIQRAELTIIEEAEAYQSLISEFGLTQEQCAQQVGKDRSTITNALRLLALPKEVQDDLMGQKLSMGHGRALIALEDKKAILRARDIVIKKSLNVRQTEQLCKRFKSNGSDKELDGSQSGDHLKRGDADMEYLLESLRTHLRTKVNIVGNSSRGKIEISFFSNAELERIMSSLGIQI